MLRPSPRGGTASASLLEPVLVGLMHPDERTNDGRLFVSLRRLTTGGTTLDFLALLHHGAQVDGLDYSETGCTKTQQMWDVQGLTGRIVCADMFSPPVDMMGQYDLVMSFGVVEHFKDTAACLKACSRFVKPEGQLFTMIPNMSGLVGTLQKYVDRDIYDIHVPLSCAMLAAAHQTSNLKIEEAQYFMGLHLGVVNSGRHAGRPVDKILRRALSIPGKLLWIAEKTGVRLPANKLTSPYIFVLARL